MLEIQTNSHMSVQQILYGLSHLPAWDAYSFILCFPIYLPRVPHTPGHSLNAASLGLAIFVATAPSPKDINKLEWSRQLCAPVFHENIKK